MIITVTCPVCEAGTVRCTVDMGDPELGLRPGVEDFDADCACHTWFKDGLVNEDKYYQRLDDSAQFAARR